ncbi:hypothetical protein [Streptomyces sp. NPDC096095]|uniref:hypothetical protein n=1 Tax=Streptomyces sp. NPDC096095 TaxID=3155545 RepID=UPI00331953FE
MNLSLGVKLLIVSICILASVIIAMVAAWLSRSPGSSINDAVLFGGGVFAGSLLLCLTVLSAVGVL